MCNFIWLLVTCIITVRGNCDLMVINKSKRVCSERESWSRAEVMRRGTVGGGCVSA